MISEKMSAELSKLNSSCISCANKTICKYTSTMESLVNKNSSIDDEAGIFTIAISCRMFRPEIAGTASMTKNALPTFVKDNKEANTYTEELPNSYFD